MRAILFAYLNIQIFVLITALKFNLHLYVRISPHLSACGQQTFALTYLSAIFSIHLLVSMLRTPPIFHLSPTCSLHVSFRNLQPTALCVLCRGGGSMLLTVSATLILHLYVSRLEPSLLYQLSVTFSLKPSVGNLQPSLLCQRPLAFISMSATFALHISANNLPPPPLFQPVQHCLEVFLKLSKWSMTFFTLLVLEKSCSFTFVAQL